jgi:hypothetical protein
MLDTVPSWCFGGLDGKRGMEEEREGGDATCETFDVEPNSTVGAYLRSVCVTCEILGTEVGVMDESRMTGNHPEDVPSASWGLLKAQAEICVSQATAQN